jgi:hypothetical protein
MESNQLQKCSLPHGRRQRHVALQSLPRQSLQQGPETTTGLRSYLLFQTIKISNLKPLNHDLGALVRVSIDRRRTARLEDMGCRLIGLCSLNFPISYGEGRSHFLDCIWNCYRPKTLRGRPCGIDMDLRMAQIIKKPQVLRRGFEP